MSKVITLFLMYIIAHILVGCGSKQSGKMPTQAKPRGIGFEAHGLSGGKPRAIRIGDDEVAVCLKSNGYLCTWDSRTSTHKAQEVRLCEDGVDRAAFSPSGNLVTVQRWPSEGFVHEIWQVSDRRLICRLQPDERLSDSGQYHFLDEGFIHLDHGVNSRHRSTFSTKTGALLSKHKLPETDWSTFTISPSGQYIAVCTTLPSEQGAAASKNKHHPRRLIKLLEMKSNKLVAQIDQSVLGFTLSKDVPGSIKEDTGRVDVTYRTIVHGMGLTCSQDGRFVLCRLFISKIAFNQTSTYKPTTTEPDLIALWDTQRNQVCGRVKSVSSGVIFSFTPNSKYVVHASDTGIALYNVSSEGLSNPVWDD